MKGQIRMLKSIRVMIVSQNGAQRQEWLGIVSTHSEMDVAADVAFGAQAPKAARSAFVDVVVLDGVDNVIAAFHTSCNLLKSVPGIKVVVVVPNDQEGYVTKGARAGVVGYVPIDRVGEDLATAISTVFYGGGHLSQIMQRELVDMVRQEAVHA